MSLKDKIQGNESTMIFIILGLALMAISYFIYDVSQQWAVVFALGVASWFLGLMTYEPKNKEAET